MVYILAALTAVLALGYIPGAWLVLRYLNQWDSLGREWRVATFEREHDVTVTHRAHIERLHELHRDQLERVFSDHRAEVQVLCQRIQAPEQAVVQHQIEHAGPGEAILPLTDEEAAEREQQLRDAIERIEAVENEGILP